MSYIHNSIIHQRESDPEPLFTVKADGSIEVKIDGYAIIPKEVFSQLVPASRVELLRDALEDMLDLIEIGMVRYNGAILHQAGQRRVNEARAVLATTE